MKDCVIDQKPTYKRNQPRLTYPLVIHYLIDVLGWMIKGATNLISNMTLCN